MKIVVDIGATHMRAARAEAPEEPQRTDTLPNFNEAMQALSALVARVAAGEVEAVAGGAPGLFEDGRIIGDVPYLPQWVGGDLEGALRAAYPGARIVFRNDGIVGCLGEARAGAGKGYERAAYACLGTGLGGDLCVGGEPQPREFMIGKQVMDAQGNRLEALVGGHGVFARYGKRFSELPPEVYASVMHTLAQGFANAIAQWRADVLVVGGGVPFLRSDFFETLHAEIAPLTPVPVVPAAFGERSVLHGALELLK